ncbi:hypothetical protein GCM10011405_04960 [Rufibacter glacialis]|nr:hypothetical protein GCM10011405_04960 [Rufibacter glacialis]
MGAPEAVHREFPQVGFIIKPISDLFTRAPGVFWWLVGLGLRRKIAYGKFVFTSFSENHAQ